MAKLYSTQTEAIDAKPEEISALVQSGNLPLSVAIPFLY